ncbi:MAG: hypothetical protein NTU61_02890 [Candidatus Altiarchaeota archaeon]|nr:hypothetical protein [Candidatus Altiarchaeota archaeon]
MNFVKDFFVGSPEDWVHQRFVRYGRGVFDGPVLEAKVGKVIKVSGSEEYCNIVGFVVVDSCPGLFSVSGSVVGKSDFRGLLKDASVPFKDKSKKGVYTVEVSGELSSDALKKVYLSSGDAAVLLTLKSVGNKDYGMKCKKKLPKPGGKKDSDFFTASMGLDALKKLRAEVFFDVPADFAEAGIEHKKDPARVRIEAKRKGVIERKVVTDGRETASKKDFIV